MPGTSDTFTTSNRLDKQPTGGNYNLWGQYLNTNFDLIDVAKDGNLQLTMSATQMTLTANNAAADQARYASITLIGTLTATGTVTAPNVPKMTVVENLTVGGFPVSWVNGVGTGISIANGVAVTVQNDANGNMRTVGGNAAGVGSQYLQKGLATIFLPASVFTPITTNGGTSTTIMCTTSSRMVNAIVFGSATSQYANFTIERMPKSWDGQNVDVTFTGFTTGASGTGIYEMDFGLAQSYDNIALDQAFNYSTNVCLGTEHSTASWVTVTGSSTGSVSSGTASQAASLSIMIRRNTTSTNQTLSGNYFMTGVTMRYNVTLANDD